MSEQWAHAEWNLVSAYERWANTDYKGKRRVKGEHTGNDMWTLCKRKMNNLFEVPCELSLYCVLLVIRCIVISLNTILSDWTLSERWLTQTVSTLETVSTNRAEWRSQVNAHTWWAHFERTVNTMKNGKVERLRDCTCTLLADLVLKVRKIKISLMVISHPFDLPWLLWWFLHLNQDLVQEVQGHLNLLYHL